MTRKAEESIRRLACLHNQAEHGPWLCVAGSDAASENWILANTGAHPDTGEVVYITTDHLRVSECRGNGAEADGQWIAETRTLAPELARHLDTVMHLLIEHKDALPHEVIDWLDANTGTGDQGQGELLP